MGIKAKMPGLIFLLEVYESIFYLIITIGSFALFLLILTFIERNVLNLISFLLLLVMLMVYLLRGTETMIKYYRIIPLYQAYVLVSLIFCQFVAQCLIIYPRVFSWIYDLSYRYRIVCWFVGYYQNPLSDTLWIKFFPYIVLFFGSVYTFG